MIEREAHNQSEKMAGGSTGQGGSTAMIEREAHNQGCSLKSFRVNDSPSQEHN